MYIYTILFFIDSLDEAKNYSNNQRDIIPKAYITKKQDEVSENEAVRDGDDDDGDDGETTNENKEAIRETIEKMRKMDNIFIDLDESDIDEFQEILHGDGDIPEDPDLYFSESHPSTNVQPKCNSTASEMGK